MEDLHWADPSSLELLRYLAVHVQTLPLLLLVTYRVDEPAGRNHFYRQLPALIRDAEGLRLDLRRMRVDDLRALVAAAGDCRRPRRIVSSTTSSAMPKATPSMPGSSCERSRRKGSCAR